MRCCLPCLRQQLGQLGRPLARCSVHLLLSCLCSIASYSAAWPDHLIPPRPAPSARSALPAVNGPSTAGGALPAFDWASWGGPPVAHLGQPQRFDNRFELMTPEDELWGGGGLEEEASSAAS